MKPNKRTFAQILSNELTAAIDTGNEDAAKLAMTLADSYLHEGKLSIQQVADMQADFDTAFPDA